MAYDLVARADRDPLAHIAVEVAELAEVNLSEVAEVHER